MSHRASAQFWVLFASLPPEVQESARRAFKLMKENPNHPSLHLKKVGRGWSVRVTRKYRALGVEAEDGIIWTWVGEHDSYENKL